MMIQPATLFVWVVYYYYFYDTCIPTYILCVGRKKGSVELIIIITIMMMMSMSTSFFYDSKKCGCIYADVGMMLVCVCCVG